MMKKISMIITTLLVSFAICGMSASAEERIVVQQEPIKVFIGERTQSDMAAKSSVEEGRAQLILEKSEMAPQDEEVALITFEKYLTLEEADRFIEEMGYCDVQEIFLGIPGVDGRAIIGKTGTGSIEERVNQNFLEMLGNESEQDMKQLLSDYKNDARIFALTVKTTNKQIAETSQMEYVSYVDIFNNPVAERDALARDVDVVYIAIPEKPDSSN